MTDRKHFVLIFVVLLFAVCCLGQNVSWNKILRTKFTYNFGNDSLRLLIENAGLGYEKHTLTTEDGYLLTLNRIVHPDRRGKDRGYPLLLINGLFMQSEAWLVQSRQDANIAIRWSELGYDVWLGDPRGTMRSIGHLNYTRNDPEYWDFSFHEIGLYDTPTFLDYVLQSTGYKDVVFSCMSLGCSFHAVLASEKPEYNKKIRGAIYFVPLINNIRKLTDMSLTMQSLFLTQFIGMDIYNRTGTSDVWPNMPALRKELFTICRALSDLLIAFMTYAFNGANHISKDAMCEQLTLAMGGTSAKSLIHVLQAYKTGTFSYFDYGREDNFKRYGQEDPPRYDLKKITSFVAMYGSSSDVFEAKNGVFKTRKSLGGDSYICLLPKFNHFDIAAGLTFAYAFPDVNEVLHALTGYKPNTVKLASGKCPSMEWIQHLKY